MQIKNKFKVSVSLNLVICTLNLEILPKPYSCIINSFFIQVQFTFEVAFLRKQFNCKIHCYTHRYFLLRVHDETEKH